MVFSSKEFLFLFLPLLVFVYYLPCFRNRAWRNAILFLSSVGFYAWGEPVFVFVMLFSVLVNWAAALAMSRGSANRKRWLSAAVAFDVLLLAVFKYAAFISGNIASLSGNGRLSLDIALPIGVSFFTFQMMSYVFDVYYGKSPAQKNPAYVGLYICFFPQLIAGPIVRYGQIEAEIVNREDSFRNVMAGMERFIYGLGKKVLLSNYTGLIADAAFVLSERPVATAWLGIVCYTMQLYFDFSGYSDMAIGLGKMFGFDFPENFDYPYTACSVTEIWKRWHISLGVWFREYVYIPLGGSRAGKSRWIRNMLVVWILTGVWHGANWTFLCWGLMQFALLVFEKRAGFRGKRGRLFHAYAMLAFMLSLVVFRADSVSAGIGYMGDMLGIRGNGFSDAAFPELFRNSAVVLAVSVVLSQPSYPEMLERLPSGTARDSARAVSCLVIFVLSVLQVVASSYNPFIYFNF